MKLDTYSFDGMGPVRCSKCGFTHELVFSGTDMDTIDDAINQALLEDGWDVEACICPDCRDPNDIKREEEEDALEEDYDELDDYEMDMNEEE